MLQGNALIVGGSRGIGAAMVRLFAENGARVAFTYAHAHDAAEALARETGALGICADSASVAEMDKAIERFHNVLGTADFLINNAALSTIALFTDLTDEVWQRMKAVNLDAPMYYVKRLLPDMIAKKQGRIPVFLSQFAVNLSVDLHGGFLYNS